jgi:hypothetical protein
MRYVASKKASSQYSRACRYEQGEKDQLQLYGDVFFQWIHFADERKNKKHGGWCQTARKGSPPPVRLKCRDLLVKQSFNKILKLLEFMENFRFVLKQIDPSEFAKVINKINIIFISSNRIASKTPNIRKDEL